MFYYICLSIFALIAYLIVTDSSVATAFVLVFKIFENWLAKIKWIIYNDPRNPIVRFTIHRKSMKMAEELMREFKNQK